MATRREFLQASVAASLLPLTLEADAHGPEAGAPRTRTEPLLDACYAVLADRRFSEAEAYAREARRQGARVVRFDGDITDFWFHDLSLRWRRGPAAIAGFTAPGPLFCLERWGWDHGLYVVSRVEQGLSRAPDALTGERQLLIAWAIAPRRAWNTGG
jgi:hypothetical protein